jgi:UDP-glucuronate 4-epimerase
MISFDQNKQYLVTGVAGFIGFYLAKRLLSEGCRVIGIDNLNDYYDVQLKKDRLNQLMDHPLFTFSLLDIQDEGSLKALFEAHSIDIILHMAAQAGVRYSIENPRAYIDSNIVGFINILEMARHFSVEHLVYASSSSVYGANKKYPFSTSDNVDFPVSLYAATKKSNELMAHTYSHLYQLPTTGLRFFTVYGPWGRPDMALFSFTEKILSNQSIPVFNHGQMERDFTYIDDIVEGVLRCAHVLPNPHPQTGAPYKIYNIGNNQPVPLMRFIEAIEAACQVEAVKEYLPMQAGDVLRTFADVDDLIEDVGFKPDTTIEDGVKKFVAWYIDYMGRRKLD